MKVACATVMKSLLLAAILVALTGHGSAVENLSVCCTNVSREEITETILAFVLQRRSGNCVNAIIFQTETGFYCSKHNEPWVRMRIKELRRELRSNRARSMSLLKLIRSSSSHPSSASSSSSSSSRGPMGYAQHSTPTNRIASLPVPTNEGGLLDAFKR